MWMSPAPNTWTVFSPSPCQKSKSNMGASRWNTAANEFVNWMWENDPAGTASFLPSRGVVVYPTTAVPLTVGQSRSVRLVDDVTANETKLVGLVAARDPEME